VTNENTLKNFVPEYTCIFLWGNLSERDHWGDPGIDGRTIFRRIFRKWDVGVWTGLS
jgi:hypothetical protein